MSGKKVKTEGLELVDFVIQQVFW